MARKRRSGSATYIMTPYAQRAYGKARAKLLSKAKPGQVEDLERILRKIQGFGQLDQPIKIKKPTDYIPEPKLNKLLRNLRTELQAKQARKDAYERRSKNPEKLRRVLFRARQRRQEDRLSVYQRDLSVYYNRPGNREPIVLPKDHPICRERDSKRSALFAKKQIGKGKSGPKEKKLTENSKVICK